MKIGQIAEQITENRGEYTGLEYATSAHIFRAYIFSFVAFSCVFSAPIQFYDYKQDVQVLVQAMHQ